MFSVEALDVVIDVGVRTHHIILGRHAVVIQRVN